VLARILAVSVSIVLVAAHAHAIDLPAPPPEYTWREVPAIKAAFLVPVGWHVREELDGKTLALFVTQEPFTPPHEFDIGLSVNVFLENPNAPNQIKQMLDGISSKHSVPLSQGMAGPFATLSCQFDSGREGRAEPVRTFYLAIANTATGTSYLAIFESPVSQWDAAWKLGKPIIDTLALESEL
jgi:hypothetical protein